MTLQKPKLCLILRVIIKKKKIWSPFAAQLNHRALISSCVLRCIIPVARAQWTRFALDGSSSLAVSELTQCFSTCRS